LAYRAHNSAVFKRARRANPRIGRQQRGAISTGSQVAQSEVDKTLELLPTEGLEYDDWLLVGMGLWHQSRGSLEADGFGRWLAWSRQSSKHDGKMMRKKMKKMDIPPAREMIQILDEAGCELYACQLAMEMFELERKDLVPQVKDIITAGDFFALSEGAQIIFT